jgi:choice-of-anchor B domain-containing protein
MLAMTTVSSVESQGQSALRLVYHWHDTTLPASAVYANVYNDVWGYAAEGREYAIIGSTMGTHFFDVTDTTNIQLVDFVPGKAQGPDIIHRDYEHYRHYLYMVCDEGQSSLQIADLSFLPDSVHLVYDSDALFTRAHNIGIDTSSARMYTFAESSAAFNALGIYSLADPGNPVWIGHWNGVGHVHGGYVLHDTAFCNSGYEGLWVMNFADPHNPQLITKLDTYQDQGYNHSGWWSEDRKAYVFTDENHGFRMKACAADDISNFAIESYFGSEIDSNSMAHNVIIRDTIAYVSYYHDGLWMFDISDLDSVTPIANYDTYLLPDHDSYRGAWGVNPLLPSGLILISDMQSGLYVFAYEDTSQVINGGPSADDDIVIGPNPFISHVVVSTGLEATLFMRDLQGRTILMQELSAGKTQVALEATLPCGLYHIEVVSEKGRFASLLFKQ